MILFINIAFCVMLTFSLYYDRKKVKEAKKLHDGLKEIAKDVDTNIDSLKVDMYNKTAFYMISMSYILPVAIQKLEEEEQYEAAADAVELLNQINEELNQ